MKIRTINNKILSIIFFLWLSSALATNAFGLTSSYTYDNLNRLTQVDYGNGLTEQYTYDAAGNRLSRLVANSANPVTYTLSFSETGTGNGYVSISPGDIVCDTNYSTKFNSGTTVTLQPWPAEYSMFAGWSGAGCGAGDCVLTMNGDTPVTGTFSIDTNHMVLIGTSSYYPTLQEAYDKAAPGGVLKVWGTDFSENLNAAINKNVTLKGGYDGGYFTNSGYTTLIGSLTVGKGSLTVEKLVVQ